MHVLDRAAEREPEGALVFFHGLYGIPDDFLAFVDKLDPARRLHAFLPTGLHPIGDEGRTSWFPPDTRPGGLEELRPVLDWLDALPFAASSTVLGGWSQGACVAYAAGLGVGRPAPAGIVALGGMLPAGVELGGATPAAIGHGRNDDAVPVEEAQRARATLEALGCEVLYLETDVDHHIDQEIVPVLRDFVARLYV